jgi:hypothetical protein
LICGAGKKRKLVLRDWEKRWHADNRRIGRIVRPSIDPGKNQVVPEDSPLAKQVLELYKGLRKAESALLVQTRTGRIGLAKFLYSREMPSIDTAQCQCGAGEETARHMALYCIQEASRRMHLTDNAGRIQPYHRLAGTSSRAQCFTKWMMFSNRLAQFTLAKRLQYDSK